MKKVWERVWKKRVGSKISRGFPFPFFIPRELVIRDFEGSELVSGNGLSGDFLCKWVKNRCPSGRKPPMAGGSGHQRSWAKVRSMPWWQCCGVMGPFDPTTVKDRCYEFMHSRLWWHGSADDDLAPLFTQWRLKVGLGYHPILWSILTNIDVLACRVIIGLFRSFLTCILFTTSKIR